MKINWLRGASMAAAVVGASFAATGAMAQDRSDWPSSVTVGTASQGGTYFIYGAGWANLIQEFTGVNSTAEVTGGPVQNMALVQSGDLNLGMITMGPGLDGWRGESELAPGMEMRDVRALFPMYETPFHFVALANSGISSVSDLEGKSVGVGPRGGTPGAYFPRFIEALGINITPQYGGASDLAGQLQDGLIHTFAFAAGIPISAFSQVEAQNAVNMFGFTEDEIAKLLEAYPSVAPFTVPAGTYASQTEDMLTVAMWNFGIAHKDLSESFIYEVMKTVLDNNDRMMQIHASAENTLVENWDKNGFMWFHPGAVRYYREKGIEIPAHLIPPEMQ